MAAAAIFTTSLGMLCSSMEALFTSLMLTGHLYNASGSGEPAGNPEGFL